MKLLFITDFQRKL